MLWCDVKDCIDGGFINCQNIANLTDRSGHGYYLANANNNFVYLTNWGGVIATTNSNNDLMIGRSTNTYAGWISKTNEHTIAIRMYYRNNDDFDLELAKYTDGSANQIYVQQLLGTHYFDFGAAGVNRVSAAYPGGYPGAFLSNWVNIVFIKGRESTTNSTIAMFGTNYASARTTTVLPSVGVTLNYQFFGNCQQSRAYFKRVLCWDYALSTNEVALLDVWMAAQP